MTLQLLLDESADDRVLRRLLTDEGHTVVIPREAGLAGAPDETVFRYATERNLIIVTKNPKDFEPLHEQSQQHPGVFAIYQDNDRTRDMTSEDICRAVRNLVEAGLPIAGEFHILNHWRY